MRAIQGSVMCAVVLAALISMAGPAAAIRPTCSELIALRDAGHSVEQIVQTYGTTRARLAACARLAEQGERFASQRAQFYLQRDQRGLAR